MPIMEMSQYLQQEDLGEMVELLYLESTDTGGSIRRHYTNAARDVRFDSPGNNGGLTYWNPFPFQFEGMEYAINGSQPEPSLKISNLVNKIDGRPNGLNDFQSFKVQNGDNLDNVKVIRIITFSSFLEGGENFGAMEDKFSLEQWYISNIDSTDLTWFNLTLKNVIDAQGSLPKHIVTLQKYPGASSNLNIK
ncbi:TPA: hypothetical protein ACX6NV_002015 [Photobacterium damselae]